ncbi:MAG TPA: hypothetical protein VL485_32945 [Ktedonobacteraceae bacterium]|jgi:hypothetical protein|nr:hypothetical protein [Ktedonobacteraceae bacterium]
MGIYLGQLPPAEVARFKAELAETLIANFCYPRFFDQRTQALRMRPVDRAKRQEVWLYLSSVDFTQWSRIDLLSPDFQVQIERLFIQFVQRNRAFFGEQGRRRMSDIRMLIGDASGGVVQGLRGHLTGQKGNHPFGSPRPVISWSALTNGKTEIGWEQISASTILLQQQLQEVRGEVRSAPVAEPRTAPATPRRSMRTGGETNISVEQSGPVSPAAASAATQTPLRPVSPMQGGRRVSAPLSSPMPATAAPAASVAAPTPLRRTETPTGHPEVVSTPQPVRGAPTESRKSGPLSPERTSMSITASNAAVQARSVASQESSLLNSLAEGQNVIGEDVAIFDQMRHQLVVWLRIEAVTAGIEIGGLSPAQLLDALRQQGRQDETRLQVVSSLLNLANQVIKAGTVSLLDYKQALMLHLMHTRR